MTNRSVSSFELFEKLAEVSSDVDLWVIFILSFFADCSILDPNSPYHHVINREPTAAIIRRCIGNSRSVRLNSLKNKYKQKTRLMSENKIVVIFSDCLNDLNILQRQTFTGIRTTKNFLLGIIWPLRQHPMAANWQYYALIQQMAVLTLALPLTQ